MSENFSLNKYNIYLFLFSLLFIFISGYLNITIFLEASSDGFYSQVTYVVRNINNPSEYSPLFIVHSLRLIIILPFYIAYSLNLPSYVESIIFIMYLLPFFKSNDLAIKISSIILLFLPLVFSYRTVLGMVGMGYLYLCLFYYKGRYLLLFTSALLANLSSGIVFGWLFSIFTSIKYIKNNYPKFLVFIIIMILGFIGSFLHKYQFMISDVGAMKNGSFWERSTLYESYQNNYYSKFIVYTSVVMAILVILTYPIYKQQKLGRKWLFFLGALPLVLFEGVGLISYLFCIIVVILSSNNDIYQKQSI
ncbi:hypothetical protein ABM000_13780 [Morganella morganii]|uniref:hypothetical protein n=1 Tax=Morganella morganii TaxID=582 RepID=UPI000538A8BE|nr:hypothetical protein [Morganella morganii]AUT99689.1 hypothetical protein MC49_005670 [Morganella morganii]AVD58140.1 hypothetical protein C4E49_01220 [Morganella morganii]EKW8500295.1 hypothetical protein [Morganella morganii]ELA7732944.1 hypothetical protein [Morganella morganii]ELA7779672.1 hypothetical protein [Morganella morganii]